MEFTEPAKLKVHPILKLYASTFKHQLKQVQILNATSLQSDDVDIGHNYNTE